MRFIGNAYNRRPGDAGQLYRLWERFHSAEIYEDLIDEPHANTLVDSWKRSKSLGADPRRRALPILSEAERQGVLHENRLLLSNAQPVFEGARQFLSGFPGLLILADGEATVLRVAGHPAVQERAATDRTLLEGALLPESVAGTNGVGTCLFLGHSVQVCSAEHFCEALQPWTCAAAPIRDPFSDAVLGVIDLSFPSNPETDALTIADSFAARIRGEIRLQVALERLQVINRHSEYAARYPSDEVLAYDRLGHLIRSSHGAGSETGDGWRGETSSTQHVHVIAGRDGGEPIGTLVVVRGRFSSRDLAAAAVS
jgi:transcriptional regulator of acetoin/glycerol metabolism